MLLVPEQPLFAMTGKARSSGNCYYSSASKAAGHVWQRAGDLLFLHGSSAVIKLLCRASEGVLHPERSLKDPNLRYDTPFFAVLNSLSIYSDIKKNRFVGLHGFFGGDGSMATVVMEK